MKSILATGATGLVGSRFVDMYADQYQVANMDLTTGVDITDKSSVEKFVSAHPADTLYRHQPCFCRKRGQKWTLLSG